MSTSSIADGTRLGTTVAAHSDAEGAKKRKWKFTTFGDGKVLLKIPG